jgi:toxin ParE1/3/4
VLTIEWRASGGADLMDILDYIGERNYLAALRLNDAIDHALEQVSEHPYLFKKSDRKPGMREIVAHPNYIVYYQVTASCIEVVNVVHTRRQFPAQK